MSWWVSTVVVGSFAHSDEPSGSGCIRWLPGRQGHTHASGTKPEDQWGGPPCHAPRPADQQLWTFHQTPQSWNAKMPEPCHCEEAVHLQHSRYWSCTLGKPPANSAQQQSKLVRSLGHGLPLHRRSMVQKAMKLVLHIEHANVNWSEKQNVWQRQLTWHVLLRQQASLVLHSGSESISLGKICVTCVNLLLCMICWLIFSQNGKRNPWRKRSRISRGGK